MVHRVERQGPEFALDPSGDQGRIQLRGKQLAPIAIGVWAGQVVDNELHSDIRGQGAVTDRAAVAQLQPGGPVGEGAAVATHGVSRGAGGNKGLGGGLGAVGQAVQRQWGNWQHFEWICIIHYVQRIIF
ncbi:hypothetical protein D3C72_1617310 [compost metagenome]